MKTKMIFSMILVFGLFFTSCSNDDDNNVVETIDLINTEYPEAEQEVIDTFGEIAQSLIDGDMDRLISFHAYSSKFTEFKDGAPRNGGVANEEYERTVFGAVTEVIAFNADQLKVAVYGDVANVTFHSDFQLMFGTDLAVINNQISLLFVNTNDGWKIVHEHHSPLN